MKIIINNLTTAFGPKVILDNISMEIPSTETIAVVGLSGTGKSVLLKSIMGIIRPDNGSIFLNRLELTNRKERDLLFLRSRYLGMVFQYSALIKSLTIEENLALPLIYGTKKTCNDVTDTIQKNLDLVDMADTGHLYPTELSGGMQKRIGVARAIIKDPDVILYDEPTSGLDPIHADEIHRLIMTLKKRFNKTSIVVTHDIQRILPIADKIAFLHEGKIKKMGTPQEFLESGDPLIQKFFSTSKESSYENQS